MLRNANDLVGYRLGATDGEFGKVRDFYFDDQAWTVRYLVADTGRWLPGKLVLIYPGAVQSADWKQGELILNITRRQIEEGPLVNEDEPVSRQKEKDFVAHYDWPYYWTDPLHPVVAPMWPGGVEGKRNEGERESGGDPNLRSIREVLNYKVEAADGNLGHVEDFILDDDDWRIRYLVIDTVNWWPGKKVLVNPAWFTGVDWKTRSVTCQLTRDKIRTAPEYDSSRPIDRDYESLLYDHYELPTYWSTP